ncbi:MAG: hypothetical protein FWC29_01485 [Methanomassiliicoccaceae archaeon]|nr:hypothetical protein [Methanomassiliicoccaceae archaeon]
MNKRTANAMQAMQTNLPADRLGRLSSARQGHFFRRAAEKDGLQKENEEGSPAQEAILNVLTYENTNIWERKDAFW